MSRCLGRRIIQIYLHLHNTHLKYSKIPIRIQLYMWTHSGKSSIYLSVHILPGRWCYTTTRFQPSEQRIQNLISCFTLQLFHFSLSRWFLSSRGLTDAPKSPKVCFIGHTDCSLCLVQCWWNYSFHLHHFKPLLVSSTHQTLRPLLEHMLLKAEREGRAQMTGNCRRLLNPWRQKYILWSELENVQMRKLWIFNNS